MVVFFCSLLSLIKKKKKKKIKGEYDDSEFLLFTQKHSNAVLFNYNTLQRYLVNFHPTNPGKVKINTVYCCQTKRSGRRVSFWVEDRLGHFDRFWDETRPQCIDQMLTTSKPILKELQEFIYLHSGYTHTIVDLQGEPKEDCFTLCDIEFTHSRHSTNIRRRCFLAG